MSINLQHTKFSDGMQQVLEMPDQNIQKRVIIFDGDCALCHFSVRWIRKNEIHDWFEYIPCQSEKRQQRYPDINHDDCMSAIHLVDIDGTVYVGAEALPVIMHGMRRWRWLSWVLRFPLVRLMSPFVYHTIARHRQFLSHGFQREGIMQRHE